MSEDENQELPPLHEEWLIEARNTSRYINQADRDVNSRIDNLAKIVLLLLSAGIAIWSIDPPSEPTAI